ncbi:MAG: hypothetical protein AAGA68_24990 [Pseudomonadota bacterium]
MPRRRDYTVSVRRHPDGKRWRVHWREGPDHKRRKITCETKAEADRTQAEIAAGVQPAEELGDYDIMRALVEYQEQHVQPNCSTKEAGNLWYRVHGARGIHLDLDGLTFGDLDDDRQRAIEKAWRDPSRMAPSTAARCVTDLSAAQNYAYRRQRLARRVPITITIPQPPRAKVELWAPEQVGAMLEQLPNHGRVYVWLLLCGSRCEAARLATPAQLDLRGRVLDTLPPGVRQTRKRREVLPLTAQARDALLALRRGKRYLVDDDPAGESDAPIASVKTMWGNARRRADLPATLLAKNFRHTLAMWAAARAVPMVQWEWLLGHRQGSANDAYIFANPDHMAELVAALSEFHQAVSGQLANSDPESTPRKASGP